MPNATRFQHKLNRLSRWATLALVGLLNLATSTPSAADPGPAAPTSSLAQALNPDGTLRPGATGSFDARQFTMHTAPDGRPMFSPARVAGTTGSGDERWQDGFTLDGTNGTVRAVVVSGSDLYIGGDFTRAGNTDARYIARWNGTVWSSVGTGAISGVDSQVFALALASNGDLYAGGYFNHAGGILAKHIARWNGTAWSALSSGIVGVGGLGGSVGAVVVASNGDVYAGGDFTTAGGVPANDVARWNGTAWSALGAGVNSEIYALATSNTGDLYAGGYFTTAGGISANGIAKWNGTAWSSMGTGIAYGNPFAIAVASNGDAYVAGNFTQAGGIAVNGIARWNGTAWSTLGNPSANGISVVGGIITIAGNGDVYTFGQNQASGSNTFCLVRWDGTTWSTVGSGAISEISNIWAMAVTPTGEVYAGGSFASASGAAASRMAKWNGTAWIPIGSGAGNGVNGAIYALAIATNGDVYVGGTFTQAGRAVANNVAKWNGTAWSALGSAAANGVGNSVYALAVAGNGDVYVGGSFFLAGGINAQRIVKWNGTAWSTLGNGVNNGVDNVLFSLALASNGDLYAGGWFYHAGGVATSHVARWNGLTWNALGAGANGDVLALAVAANGDVYAGGPFTAAGGTTASGVARWNGSTWSSVGAGLNYTVQALTLATNGDVYAGGTSTTAGGATTSSVARWNGTTWFALGTGFNNTVRALALAANGDLYAGGIFTAAGGTAASNIAKWNGTAWGPIDGTGLNGFPYGSVYALATGQNGKLYAGGIFTGVADGSKVMAGFGAYDLLAPLATARSTRASAFALYPNPAHGEAALVLPAATQVRSVQVFDATGREVRRQSLPARATAITLDVVGLPVGVYTVRVDDMARQLVVE